MASRWRRGHRIPDVNFGEPPKGEVGKEGRAGKMERGREECTGSRYAPVLWGRPAKERNTFAGYYAESVPGMSDRGHADFGEPPFHALG